MLGTVDPGSEEDLGEVPRCVMGTLSLGDGVEGRGVAPSVAGERC